MKCRLSLVAIASVLTGITCSVGVNVLHAESKQPLVVHLWEQAVQPPEATEATELRRAAITEYKVGHFGEALRLLQNALTLAVQQSDLYVVALIHDSFGTIYLEQYEFTKAEEEFKKAVDILRRQHEHSHALAMTLANLGAALCDVGRPREASALASEADRLIKEDGIRDPALQLHILNVSATAYLRQRQFKKAEAIFRQAVQMSSLPENATIPEGVDVFNNLATLYATRGNPGKAVDSYRRALQMAETRLGSNHPSIVMILQNLGFTYTRMAQYEEAEPLFRRALNVLEYNHLMASPMGINILYGVARTSMEKNQLERAQVALGQAVEIGHAIRARTPEMVDTLELYSTVLRSLSKYSESEDLHTEASRIRAELALTTRVDEMR